MEAPVSKKIRIFRGEETILNILGEYKKSNLSIKAFCAANNIAQAVFCSWKKKYGKSLVKPSKAAGFTSFQIAADAVSASVLFAEVNHIRIYQPVTASYLKELLS